MGPDGHRQLQLTLGQTNTEVLIVGAGPVGLSAALLLARAGCGVRIVDAASGIDQRMRASTFHPPTLDMLDTLGLAEPLVEMGLRVPRFQIRQHESGEHVTFDLGLIADETAHPFRLQIEQHRYAALAAEALLSMDVAVEFDTRIESVSQDDSTVRAVTASGETLCSRWLIGTDGGHSAVRTSLGLDYGGKTYTHSSVLVATSFAFDERLDELTDVAYCWSRRGPFSLLRLRKLWRASLYPGVESLEDAADEERVRDWLGYIHPDARDADLLHISPYRVHERCVERFRVGRVLLAGDAAHLNAPSGGMGMNGGIHDAFNLCNKLVAVLGGAPDALLDDYGRERRQVAAQKVIPRASANRERMAPTNLAEQMRKLARMRAIADDADSCRQYLLDSSMITSLRPAGAAG